MKPIMLNCFCMLPLIKSKLPTASKLARHFTFTRNYRIGIKRSISQEWWQPCQLASWIFCLLRFCLLILCLAFEKDSSRVKTSGYLLIPSVHLVGKLFATANFIFSSIMFKYVILNKNWILIFSDFFWHTEPPTHSFQNF